MPDEWLVGCIVPIYEGKGDVVDVNSYRGINLLNGFGKLFTSILNATLTQYCDGVNLISETQPEFRKDYSTIDHTFVLKCIIDLFIWKKTAVRHVIGFGE